MNKAKLWSKCFCFCCQLCMVSSLHSLKCAMWVNYNVVNAVLCIISIRHDMNDCRQTGSTHTIHSFTYGRPRFDKTNSPNMKHGWLTARHGESNAFSTVNRAGCTNEDSRFMVDWILLVGLNMRIWHPHCAGLSKKEEENSCHIILSAANSGNTFIAFN